MRQILPFLPTEKPPLTRCWTSTMQTASSSCHRGYGDDPQVKTLPIWPIGRKEGASPWVWGYRPDATTLSRFDSSQELGLGAQASPCKAQVRDLPICSTYMASYLSFEFPGPLTPQPRPRTDSTLLIYNGCFQSEEGMGFQLPSDKPNTLR